MQKITPCLALLSMISFASAEEIMEMEDISLPETKVVAEKNDDKKYDKEKIDALTKGNRDITSLIADIPAVRVNQSSAKVGNRGSLAPESFSIYGESPYQNKFSIDGSSFENVINPEVDRLVTPQYNKTVGFSQVYNIDTDLIDSVKVYDSRIGAEYGGFTGGVIDAKLKKPLGLNAWKVKSSYNTSSMTEQAYDGNSISKRNFEQGAPGSSPNWKKIFYSLVGDISLGKDVNALISYSERTSKIDREVTSLEGASLDSTGRYYQLSDASRLLKPTFDKVQNLFAKINYDIWGGSGFDISLRYSKRKEDAVSISAANWDVGWENKQEAYGLSLDFETKLNLAKLSYGLSYDRSRTMVNDGEDTYYTILFKLVPGYSTYNYGGYGRHENNQNKIVLKSRLDFDNFSFFGGEHKLYAGLEVSSVKADFSRGQDVFTEQWTYTGSTTSSVVTGAITKKVKYKAGNVGADYNSLAAYFSDQVAYGDFVSSFGLRLDRDDFLGNNNIAPRFKTDWDIFGDNNLTLGFGWSRYYGINLIGYQMAEVKNILQEDIVGNSNVVVGAHNFDGLKTPYSDEISLLFSSKSIDGYNIFLDINRRNSRDAILREKITKNRKDIYTYTNNGRGKNSAISIGFSTLEDLSFAGAKWNISSSFGWQWNEKSYDAIRSWEGQEDEAEEIITFNGVKMKRRDAPSLTPNQPRKLSVAAIGKWGSVVIGNRAIWNSSKNAIQQIGGSQNNYATMKLPSYWQWDIGLTWTSRSIKGFSLNLEVNNVLNKLAQVGLTNIEDSKGSQYQVGREIWLNSSYEF